jgi:Protein of unknown function (DUF4241)
MFGAGPKFGSLTMTLKELILSRVGEFPRSGVQGVEGEWLSIGNLNVSTGSLCAVDAMMLARSEGFVTKVVPGAYSVQGKGMNFKGHIRVSRIRAFLENSEPKLGERVGVVGIDTASFAFCDIEDIEKYTDGEAAKEFWKELERVDIQGGEIVALNVSGEFVRFAACESGLGDGGYPVFALRDGSRVIGLEVEFIPFGYSRRPARELW